MARCTGPNCTAWALTGDLCALCAQTMTVTEFRTWLAGAEARRAAAARAEAARIRYILMAPGTNNPNADFAAACEDYLDRIQAIMHRGAPLARGEDVFGHRLLHDTQPRANRTVFYDWQGPVLRIFAVGGHVGNDNSAYEVTWYNGRVRTWRRQ